MRQALFTEYHSHLQINELASMRQKKAAVCGWAVPADREGLRPLRSARTFGQDGGTPAQTALTVAHR